MTNCYFYPKSRWFIARKELSRLKKTSYITFTKVCSHHKIPRDDWKLNSQDNYIEFKNGSHIDLLDLDYQPRDPEFERFGSMEYTGGWIEEAGEIRFGAFDVLKTRIGRHLNKEYDLPPKMLITCNPSKDWLYRLVYRPFRKNELPEEYAFIQSLYRDNPHTAKTYEKQLSGIRDKARKQRLMFGNWEYDTDAGLIEYDAIIDLFTNTPEIGSRYLTADIARYGSAKTVYMLWKGFQIIEVIVKQKQGIDDTTRDIQELLERRQIPYSHCIVDEDGVGGGVKDNLRGIKGFVANSVPLENPTSGDKENYKNLKAQCGYMLADKINDRGIGFKTRDDFGKETGIVSETQKEEIIEELEQIRSKDVEKDAKLQLVPKEEIIENIGRSPDYSDTILMRMWFELKQTVKSRTWQFRPEL